MNVNSKLRRNKRLIHWNCLSLYSNTFKGLTTGRRLLKCLSRAIAICVLAAASVPAMSSGFSTSTPLTFSLTEQEKMWLHNHKKIRLAFDGDFPPYSFLNENNELEGFSVDVFNIMAKSLEITFEPHVFSEWSSLYQSAQERQVDIVATMVQRDDRQQWFEFTTPYIHKSLVIITQEDNDTINHREDIKNKTLALVRGYQYVGAIINEYPSVTPLYVDTMRDALHAVSIGDADAAITFLGAGHYYRNKYLMSNLKYAAIYDKNSANESIAVRNDWIVLKTILDKVIKSIPEQQRHALRSRWLPVEYMEAIGDINLTDTELKWIKEHKNIRLGVDPEFAPFEYLDNHQYAGMASDYVKILNQRLNLNMRVVEGLSWKEVTEKAKNKEIDVLPAVGKTDERARYLNFTDPYLSFHRVIVTRDNIPFIASLQDLNTHSVAVQVNTSHHGFINENTDITPKLYRTLQESLLAVSGGEVDAFIGNVASTTYWIRKLNLSNLKVAAPVSTEVQSLHFAVRDDWPELASILQKGLNTITPRQRKLISEKWLTVRYDPKVDFGLVWKIVFVFSALLAVIILWNVLLNNQVKKRTSQLAYSSNYDQLTDLPNRFLVMDRLQYSINEIRQKDEKIALLSVDLDDFKKVNDAYGHKIGDNLLKEISTRIRSSVSENDTVGRLGGDQFLIIVPHINDISDAALLSKNVLKQINTNYSFSDKQISITASIGVSIFPDDGDSAETLLKNSDTATHYSKKQSPGSYTFYTENLLQNVSRRLDLEHHMRGALSRNEFEVYYQPKVFTGSRNIASFEALLRWHNPELGTVSPAEFIPVAEKNGLIEPIGMFVLASALETLAHWQQRFNTSFKMAVNLSPIQFRSSDFVPQIESIILNAGVSCRSLEFEITEGVLLSENPTISKKLNQLETLGITLSMDDFGTGYSSLSYLRSYKFASLKIDKEFITDIATNDSDRKLVLAAIAMAHGLGMTVVAEGVETEQQCDILNALECDFAQGWLFSKALPKEEVEKLLS